MKLADYERLSSCYMTALSAKETEITPTLMMIIEEIEFRKYVLNIFHFYLAASAGIKTEGDAVVYFQNVFNFMYEALKIPQTEMTKEQKVALLSCDEQLCYIAEIAPQNSSPEKFAPFVRSGVLSPFFILWENFREEIIPLRNIWQEVLRCQNNKTEQK